MYLREIGSLENSIYSLSQSVAVKQEEIERLEITKSSLIEYQAEFHSNKSLCTDPTLCENTWHGNWANHFQVIQEDEIVPVYETLSEDKINEILTQLSEEISVRKESIASMEQSIITKETRLRQVRELAREEVLK